MRAHALALVAAVALAGLVAPAWAAAPFLRVAPTAVAAGGAVTFTGSTGTPCSPVTLISRLFPGHAFGGEGAISVAARAGGGFSRRFVVPWTRARGAYVVTARCGGGNLGVAARLTVRAAASGGLSGTVRRGPTMPVCRVGVPCDGPAPGVTLTFSRAGLVRSARTDLQGAYRLALPPGTYSVRTDSRPFGVTPRPAAVRVRAGHWDRVAFTIDTGIR